MAELVLDRAAVSAQLTGVGTAFSQVDRFYGFIASIPFSGQDFSSAGGLGADQIWGSLDNSCHFWFDSWRSRIVHDLFTPFEIENTSVNCIESLAGRVRACPASASGAALAHPAPATRDSVIRPAVASDARCWASGAHMDTARRCPDQDCATNGHRRA